MSRLPAATIGSEGYMAARKKTMTESIGKDLPVYSIGVAARLLNVHPRTLRIYEDEGLIRPHREGPRRMFSQNDLQWIGCLRSAIHEQGISIPGIRKLLRYATCYEIVECPEQVACSCEAVVDRVIPRKLHRVGDIEEAERIAREEREARRLERQAGAGEKQTAKKRSTQ
jgi:MerR family transcriptional regulator, heat shock protein HspR